MGVVVALEAGAMCGGRREGTPNVSSDSRDGTLSDGGADRPLM